MPKPTTLRFSLLILAVALFAAVATVCLHA